MVYSVCKCYVVSFENVYRFLIATEYRIVILFLSILSTGSASIYQYKKRGHEMQHASANKVENVTDDKKNVREFGLLDKLAYMCQC